MDERGLGVLCNLWKRKCLDDGSVLSDCTLVSFVVVLESHLLTPRCDELCESKVPVQVLGRERTLACHICTYIYT